MQKKRTLNVSIVQMQSHEDLEANKELILDLLNQSVQQSRQKSRELDLVCFPENCTFIRVSAQSMRAYALSLQDKFLLKVGQIAHESNCQVHLGGVPFEEEGEIYNATLVISSPTQIELAYKKIHLFDVEVGGQSISESQFYKAGTQPKVVLCNGWKLGLSICYDIRFSELYSRYALDEVDVLLVPSAFLPQTGQAHWLSLLRARAIESQAFLLAPAQYGHHREFKGDKERQTHGESMVIDPWGRVICNLGEAINQFQLVTLDQSLIDEARRQIPMKSHRKLQK